MNIQARSQVAETKLIGAKWSALYFATIGAFAGFLGSVAILGAEIAGARVMGFAPFMLMRYYATLHDGPGALLMSSRSFILDAFSMHLAFGSALGAVFVLLASWQRIEKFRIYVAAGVGFGLCVWIFNFYFLLIWLQPLINGKAFIVENIPWWVAAMTHAAYGVTVALVSYPFRNDVRN